MILRTEFARIDTEIKQVINDSLDQLRVTNPSNYTLFLADGEYKEEYERTTPPLNPHVIDSRMDKYMDETRLTFLSDFLSLFYAFPSTQATTDDDQHRLHMELMIYTHIWESKPFLKKLYRLTALINAENYPWRITVPEMGKHTFIRQDIREKLERLNHPLASIIKKGFHTSLRNAFAHSEYSFDTMNGNRRINLYNYGGDKTWELENISFDDWSLRFVYSALLSFYLLKITYTKRASFITDIGADVFTIPLPNKNGGGVSIVPIRYRPIHDAFNFER